MHSIRGSTAAQHLVTAAIVSSIFLIVNNYTELVRCQLELRKSHKLGAYTTSKCMLRRHKSGFLMRALYDRHSVEKLAALPLLLPEHTSAQVLCIYRYLYLCTDMPSVSHLTTYTAHLLPSFFGSKLSPPDMSGFSRQHVFLSCGIALGCRIRAYGLKWRRRNKRKSAGSA